MLRVTTIAVVVLAAIDALCHLSLNLFALHRFTGNLFANLFTLYFLGYVVALAAYLWAQSASLGMRKLLDGVLALFPIVALITWVVLTRARGNPLGLAYVAKPAEVLLLIALALHFTALNRQPAARAAPT